MVCKIIDYSVTLKPLFESLNREWIEAYFSIESHDVKCFRDPEAEILQKSGDIFFAELNGEIVGTCALIYDEEVLELAKLAVTQSARGKGIGEILSQEAIRRAREKKEKILQLTTNSQLIAAVHLYKKLGFKETFRGQHPKYKRVDLVMEKEL